MGWKNLSYWLRGGVIGILFGLIPFIILFIFSQGLANDVNNILIFWDDFFYFDLGIYIGLLMYAILGALIGWIIGKIKAKK